MVIEINDPAPALDEDGNPIDEPIEREDLFSLNGVMYRVDKNPRRGIVLEYLKIAREQGPRIAVGWLLEEMLGTDGYLALSRYQGLTEDQLSAVTKIAVDIAMGALEDPKD